MNFFTERKIVAPLLILLGMSSLFYRCSTTKTSQQSPGRPDTVTVTADDRKIFIADVFDAIPNEDGTYNSVYGATVSLLGTEQSEVTDSSTIGGQLYFYDVPEVFTLRATHPDYEPGEVTVDMKKLKRIRPDAPRHGTVIYLKKKR